MVVEKQEILFRLFPPVDRIGLDERGIVLCRAVAHAERVSVCEVFWNVTVIHKRDVRTFSGKADVITPIYFVAMGKQSNSRPLPSANCGKQHSWPPHV